MKNLLKILCLLLVSNSLSAQWALTGNAGTTPATNYVGTSDAKDFVTRTNAAERIRVLSSNGYVGINQANPASRLHVGLGSLSGITGGTFPEASVSAADVYDAQDGGMFAIVSGDTLLTDTNFVNHGGSMIFGGRDTRNSLHVATLARISGRKENNTSFNYQGYLKFETRPSGASLAERMRITSTGFVGIGTTVPAHLLQLGTDDAAKPGTNTWIIASDKRLKTGISPYKDGLSLLMQINPVKFRYNGVAGMPTDKEYVGIIAQEVQKVAPYMVGTSSYTDEKGAQGSYLNYDGNAMTYILINSVKELKAELEQSKSAYATLQSQINDICSGGCAGFRDASSQQTGGNVLLQNVPNPFSGQTVIGYTIANGSTGYLNVNGLDGKQIRHIEVAKGQGTVTFNGGDLSSGTYTYSLYVDGKVIDTKLMVVSSSK